jgi:predicted Zn-dependent protease with MMP-like domain
MTNHEFDGMVGDIFDSIPKKFLLELGETALVSADEDPGDGELLGFFEGVPRTEQSMNDVAPIPNKIIIFKRPIEREAAETDGDTARVIRETIIHEIAHCLGYDEEEVEEKFESRWKGEGCAVP